MLTVILVCEIYRIQRINCESVCSFGKCVSFSIINCISIKRTFCCNSLIYLSKFLLPECLLPERSTSLGFTFFFSTCLDRRQEFSQQSAQRTQHWQPTGSSSCHWRPPSSPQTR